MVEVLTQPGRVGHTLLLARSNVSISLGRLAAVYLCLCASILLVAAGPVIAGFWPVLPIALCHMLVLGGCLRHAWRRHWVRECILIGPRRVSVDHAALKDLWRIDWPTPWLKVLRECTADGETRVFLGHHSARIEIGAFLPHRERIELAHALDSVLKPYSAWKS